MLNQWQNSHQNRLSCGINKSKSEGVVGGKKREDGTREARDRREREGGRNTGRKQKGGEGDEGRIRDRRDGGGEETEVRGGG